MVGYIRTVPHTGGQLFVYQVFVGVALFSSENDQQTFALHADFGSNGYPPSTHELNSLTQLLWILVLYRTFNIFHVTLQYFESRYTKVKAGIIYCICLALPK